VRLLHLGLASGLLLGLAAGAASAGTLDFEGFWDGSEYCGPLPEGYGGFTWSDSAYWGSYEYFSRYAPNGYLSTWCGDVGIYTSHEEAISIGGPLFDFGSARVGSAWDTGQGVTFEGWLDGDLLYSSTITVDTQSGDYNFGFEGINTLWVLPDTSTGTKDPGTYAAGSGHHIALDNITISRSSTPEPAVLAMLALFALPLACTALRRRLRRS